MLPSFNDYYIKHGKIAPLMTIGFSYLMALYSRINKEDNKYTVKLNDKTVEFKDDVPYLEYFANKGSVEDFMKNKEIWGKDLTEYVGFYQAVSENIIKIEKGICLI